FDEVGVLGVRGTVNLISVALQRLDASTGSKLNKRLERAALRNRVNGVLRDDRLNLGLRYVHDWSCAGHFNCLFSCANLQSKVDRWQFANFECQARLLQCTEALRRHRNRVRSRGQVRKSIISAGIGFNFLDTDECRRSYFHRRTGNHGALLVLYGTLHAAGRFLRERGRNEDRRYQQAQYKGPSLVKFHIYKSS